MLQERMSGFVEQRLQRVRVGGVSVFVRLVFGISSSSNSTTCSCFGEPRLICLPITAYAASAASRIWSPNWLCSEPNWSEVHGDTRGFHARQHPLNRQFHLGQQ